VSTTSEKQEEKEIHRARLEDTSPQEKSYSKEISKTGGGEWGGFAERGGEGGWPVLPQR